MLSRIRGLRGYITTRGLFWIGVAFVVLVLVLSGVREWRRVLAERQRVEDDMRLQLRILSATISTETTRGRVAEYIHKSSHGKLDPQQCVLVSGAVMDAHTLYNLDVSLCLALLEVESGFDPRSRSATNALGLAQVLPSTARPYLRLLQARSGLRAEDHLMDPDTCTRVGLAYLADLRDSFTVTPPPVRNPVNGVDPILYYSVVAYNIGETAARERFSRGAYTLGYADSVFSVQRRIRESGGPE